jgi:hypothetical protein
LKVLQYDLHGVFDGCETWSVAVDEKLGKKVIEGRVMGHKFVSKLERLKRRLLEMLHFKALRSLPLKVKVSH